MFLNILDIKHKTKKLRKIDLIANKTLKFNLLPATGGGEFII